MPVETEADRRAFFDTAEFAREAIYTPAGGAARTIAILDDWQALDLMTDGVAGIEVDGLTVSALVDAGTAYGAGGGGGSGTFNSGAGAPGVVLVLEF